MGHKPTFLKGKLFQVKRITHVPMSFFDLKPRQRLFYFDNVLRSQLAKLSMRFLKCLVCLSFYYLMGIILMGNIFSSYFDCGSLLEPSELSNCDNNALLASSTLAYSSSYTLRSSLILAVPNWISSSILAILSLYSCSI